MEVHIGHQLGRRHLGQQPPQRLAGQPGPQVPHRVDHAPGRHVDDALLRAEPAQLHVGGERAPERDRLGAISAIVRPTTWWARARTAAQVISLPRPLVNVRPAP
jgi:hypothetical protein